MMWPFFPKRKSSELHGRTMQEQFEYDINEILLLANAAWPNRNITRESIAYYVKNDGMIQVSKHTDHVGGYMFSKRIRRKRIITDIVVPEQWRRMGHGTDLVHTLQYNTLPGHRITVTVSEYNTTAHLFWKAMGFRAKILHNYYNDGTDAYRFVWRKNRKPPSANRSIYVPGA